MYTAVMATDPGNKTYLLQPSWKHFFWHYFFAVLAIPLAGIGLVALYFVRKKHRSIRYEIRDDRISIIGRNIRRNVDLADIEHVEIRRSRFEQKLGIGTIALQTSELTVELAGIEEPAQTGNLIEKALQAIQMQRERGKSTPTIQSKYDPGSMEKMDYLTGLWQQGLLSDEDFEKERKHFED